jgi:hypothetical protein
MTKRNENRAFDLDDQYQPSMFGESDRDLLDDIAGQATEADYVATAELLKLARS